MQRKTLLISALILILILTGCQRQTQIDIELDQLTSTSTTGSTETDHLPVTPPQNETQDTTDSENTPPPSDQIADPATLWTPLCESFIYLRESPGGEPFSTIPVGAELILQKWVGASALVTYQGTAGYVSANYIQPADSDYFANNLKVVAPSSRYSYAQMLTDMEYLRRKYPNLVYIETIGQSELGRRIPMIRIGDPNAKYHVLIQGAMHGREYATAWLIMALADHTLLQNDPLLQNVCYHMIPMVNPDGVIVSQREKLDDVQYTIYQNDFTSGYTGSTTSHYAQQWKANALGIDLNRNFPSGWEVSLEHTQPSSERYRGNSPLCAAESKALAQYTCSRHFDATISMHAFGSVLYYQYGDKQPVNKLSYDLALAVQNVTGYTPTRGDGTTGAGYKDWAMDELGIPSITIEIGSTVPPLAYGDLYNTFARFQSLLPAISQWLSDQ